MDLGFINLPLWILICVSSCICLIYLGITRHKIDRKIIIAIYFTSAPLGFLVVVHRLIKDIFVQFIQYNKYILYVMIGVFCILFLEMAYAMITTKGDRRSRRLIKIATIIFIISLTIPLVVFAILTILGD